MRSSATSLHVLIFFVLLVDLFSFLCLSVTAAWGLVC